MAAQTAGGAVRNESATSRVVDLAGTEGGDPCFLELFAGAGDDGRGRSGG